MNWALVRSFAIIGFVCVWSPSTMAAVYYVDGVNGMDSNTGLSESQAFQSVARVNLLSLAPSDAVLFKRSQTFSGTLNVSGIGSLSSPITFGAWGSGDDPILFEVRLSGSHIYLQDLTIDHQKSDSDAIRLRNCLNCILRRLLVRNGTKDGIDVDVADRLLIEDVEIHHFLNGSFGSKDDSHGIVATNTSEITIRSANIHHVSGDSFQADPNRSPGNITDHIVIEDSILWTGPLQEDFNSGWRSGDSPGENAIDTKVLKSGYDNEIRMNITLVNVVAHGWTAVPEISNRAAFNLKEKINAQLDRVTVFNSEIAFRIRGALGNADTIIKNAVIYDVEKAIRAEDDLANLRVYNSTFGDDTSEHLQHAGGSGGTATWDWRNNVFMDSKPSEASAMSNIIASPADFVDTNQGNYRPAPNSSLIDQGVVISAVIYDRDGALRVAPYDSGAYEYRDDTIPPAPPALSVQQ